MNAIAPTTPGKIYSAIAAIIAEVGPVGKNSVNAAQKYKYRSADDISDAVHDSFGKHKVFMSCEILERNVSERESKGGGVLFYVNLKARYTFHAEDGSSFTSEAWGEAMDSGDKATNKAMTAAYKYVLLQVFCLMGHDDSETDSPEPVPQQRQEYAPRQQLPVCPKCDRSEGVIVGKAEYGAGLVCYKAKGGCGHTWGPPEFPFNDKHKGNGKAKSQPAEESNAGNAELFEKMASTLKTIKDRNNWRDRVTANFDINKIDFAQLKSLMNLNIADARDADEAEQISVWLFNIAAGQADGALDQQANLLKAKRATLEVPA